MRQHIVSIVFLLLLSIMSIRPLLSEGFFPIHDDTQVGRVVAMGRALRNGQFPVRWVRDLGYGFGYPLFNYYGPLPYYVGGAFYALGVSGLLATKIMFGIGIIGAALGMYWFVASEFGSVAGVVSAIAYLYAPYHAVQIYVRGAVGEFWALIFLPILFYGISLTLRTDSGQALRRERITKGILIGSVGLAGSILSHTIYGYITTVEVCMVILILIVAVLFSRENWNTARNLVVMTLLGLGLSLFFWLPAIVELNLTNVGTQIGGAAYWKDHFVCIGQLWNSPWGFGGSAPGCIDGMSFKLGKVHILLSLLGILTAIGFGKFFLRKRKLLVTVTVLSILSLIMLLSVSAWLWLLFPMASFIQYPWRFLGYTVFGLSILCCLPIVALRQRTIQLAVAIIVVALIVGVNGKLFQPQYAYFRSTASFETDEELRYRVSKISDEYLPPSFLPPRNISQIPQNTIALPQAGTVETERDTETMTKAILKLSTKQMITINRVHFPGWRYYIDGKEVTPVVSKGIPTLDIEEGTHGLEMKFTDTWIRIVGNLGSLISVFVLISCVAQYEKKAFA